MIGCDVCRVPAAERTSQLNDKAGEFGDMAAELLKRFK